MKSNVLLSFKRQSQAEQAAFINDVVNKMTNDAQFVSLAPQIGELKKRYDAYQIAASNAVNGGKLATMEKDTKLADVMYQLTLVARMVDVLANENEVIILAAGFEVRKKPTPVTELSAPTDIKAINAERSGVAKLTWKAVEGATIYGIERREKGTDMWRNGDYSASRSITIEGLTINTQSEFMIRAINGKGIKSDWSQVVEVLVS